MVGIVYSAQFVVIEHYAVDSAIACQGAGLGLDLLRGKDAPNGRQVGVPVEKFQVASELFHAVDVTPALDFNRYRRTVSICSKNVYRAHRCHVFTTNQSITLAEGLDVGSEQALKVCFNAVFDEARVNT
jgi:hypothetical protein